MLGVLLPVASVLCFPIAVVAQVGYYPLAHGNFWNYNGINRSVIRDTTLPDGRTYSIIRESHYGQITAQRQQGDTVFSGIGDSQILYDFTRIPGDTLWVLNNRINILVSTGDTSIFHRTLRRWSFRRLFGGFGTGYGYEFDTVVDSLGLVETGEINDVSWWSMNLSGAIIDGRQYGTIDAVPPLSPVNTTSFSLEQNFPNPFNPTTTIGYSIPQRVQVALTLFDALGRIAAQLVNQYQENGSHTVRFDGSAFASGVYFCRLAAGRNVATTKIVLIK